MDLTRQATVLKDNDWVWVLITFKAQDLYKRDVWDWNECNPKPVKVGKKYFLHISYKTKVELSNKKINEQKICAVDLKITNSAVCSIMDASGTVLAREFINQAKEKDHLYTMTNKLRNSKLVFINCPSFGAVIPQRITLRNLVVYLR